MTGTPEVGVVVPWYRQQEQLDLLLSALELQTLEASRFEVVIADDGSPRPPEPGPRPFVTRRVCHSDKGFRASAARRLGATATHAPVLCFLDADTVPEPGYLERLTAVVADGPRGTLAVGRRRHADLAGWTPSRLRSWLCGQRPGPRELDEPRWLRDGYRATADLRDADERSYRYVISAVMALPRSLYERAGGFDPRFVGYGGEDWDLAHRCWLAGGDLRHVPDAIAWHDGPDFAGRPDVGSREARDAETLRLAQVLTDPLARGPGLVWTYPETVVRVLGRLTDGEAALTAGSVLRGSDAAVWFTGLDQVPAGLAADPRVHVGEPPIDVLQHARHQAEVARPVTLEGTVTDLTRHAPVDVVADGEVLLRVRRTRDVSRPDPPSPVTPSARQCGVAPVDDEATLEARWGGWA